MATDNTRKGSSGKPEAAMAQVFDRLAQDKAATADERMQARRRAVESRKRAKAIKDGKAD